MDEVLVVKWVPVFQVRIKIHGKLLFVPCFFWRTSMIQLQMGLLLNMHLYVTMFEARHPGPAWCFWRFFCPDLTGRWHQKIWVLTNSMSSGSDPHGISWFYHDSTNSPAIFCCKGALPQLSQAEIWRSNAGSQESNRNSRWLFDSFACSEPLTKKMGRIVCEYETPKINIIIHYLYIGACLVYTICDYPTSKLTSKHRFDLATLALP